ncbi:MAG: hypothetical protein KA221_00830 [Vitreoscilla sp.]|nr:hypothetical protein [Vitreoscilla sp.]
MSDEKKRSRGKPKRYENEESERLSVLVRPRYKKIIETIAKARQTTISEAMEFAIAYTARNNTLEDRSFYQWVLPANEIAERSERYANAILDGNDSYEENFDKFVDFYDYFYDKPILFRKPYESYIRDAVSAYEELGNELELSISHIASMFDTDKFISAIHEDWKAAVDISTLARELIIINTLFRADLLFYRNMISEPGDLYSAISWALFKFGNKPLTKELLESIATEKNLLQIKNSYIFTNNSN